jgi:hypothetical protein
MSLPGPLNVGILLRLLVHGQGDDSRKKSNRWFILKMSWMGFRTSIKHVEGFSLCQRITLNDVYLASEPRKYFGAMAFGTRSPTMIAI